MASVRFEARPMRVSPLGDLGELILDSGGGRVPTEEEALLLGVDSAHADRPPTVLPYRFQDTYGRDLATVDQRVAVLENDHLIATFLLDLGGRLWNLIDKSTGRDLLHQPDAIQVANLSLRNAWFAGGVEWNLGVTGHWGLTCEPVCAGIVDGDVLRLWAHERLLGLTWRLDAWLPDGATKLATHVVLHNPTDDAVPVYWWSNVAVPQGPDTRVLVEADSAFHFGYAYQLSEVSIPERNGRDITWPARHTGAADYFYRARAPWIAAVGADGVGLGQCSTDRMRGRKLFTWGEGSGGRTWQRWLSGDGAYAEIQSGLASTQLEHLALAAGETWRFTELYGAVHLDDLDRPWPELVASAREDACAPELLARAEAHLTGVEDHPVALDPAPVPGDTAGWGALEVAAGHRAATPATPFPADLSEEQRAWLRLATDTTLDPVLQTSAMVGPQWAAALQRAEPGWLRDLLLGHAAHADGDTARARELWTASVEEHPTPDSWRALALTDDNADARCECLMRAHWLDPQRPGIAVEAIRALIDTGHPAEALELIENLALELREGPRLQYLEASARVRVGDADGAGRLIDKPLVLPDLREGDLSLDQLWDDYQALRGTAEPLPAHYDFRMAVDPTAKEYRWT